jgi:hypothetical protein
VAGVGGCGCVGWVKVLRGEVMLGIKREDGWAYHAAAVSCGFAVDDCTPDVEVLAWAAVGAGAAFVAHLSAGGDVIAV